MNYQQAVDYLTNLSSIEQKRPGLERIEKFLLCHDSPQNDFYSLHIGGTNGKGSTVAMLDSMLRTGGIKVGRFIGPHILRLNERIHIDGLPIKDGDFAEGVSDLKTKSGIFGQEYPEHGSLSWFEFITALAFFSFAKHKVDLAVIEVGMGGTFDATNTLQKVLATGITNISLDHTRVLGDTVEKIAQEKAGIIKKDTPVITAAKGAALDLIAKRAKNLNAKLIVCDHETFDQDHTTINESLIQIKSEFCQHGLYQYENARLALCILSAANLLQISGSSDTTHKITMEQALRGLKNFYWPGRFQAINSSRLILDCAHNPDGIKRLRNSLDNLLPGQNFAFIFACYADKDQSTMLKNLLRKGDRLYLIQELSGERSFFSNSSLATLASDLGVTSTVNTSIADAIEKATTKLSSNEIAVATGSFSVVKATMLYLGWKCVEDGINEPAMVDN